MREHSYKPHSSDIETLATRITAKAFNNNYDGINADSACVTKCCVDKYRQIIEIIKIGVSKGLNKSWTELPEAEIGKFLGKYETLKNNTSSIERKEDISDMLAQALHYHQIPCSEIDKFQHELSDMVADPLTFKFVTQTVWNNHPQEISIDKNEVHNLYNQIKQQAAKVGVDPENFIKLPDYNSNLKKIINNYFS